MIIGIAGTTGAGKGTVVDYLKEKGFTHISARAIWTLELEARDIEVNRDTMTVLANELRAEHGASYFVQRALQEAPENGSCVIESIRAVGEVELLKKQGGIMMSVTADQQTRFDRISQRGTALDDVTFDDFVRQENAEMQNDDPSKQNIAAVIESSDFVLENNGTVEELRQQVDEVLTKIAG